MRMESHCILIWVGRYEGSWLWKKLTDNHIIYNQNHISFTPSCPIRYQVGLKTNTVSCPCYLPVIYLAHGQECYRHFIGCLFPVSQPRKPAYKRRLGICLENTEDTDGVVIRSQSSRWNVIISPQASSAFLAATPVRRHYHIKSVSAYSNYLHGQYFFLFWV